MGWAISWAISHFFPFLKLAQQKVEQKIHSCYVVDVLAVLFYSHAVTENGVWLCNLVTSLMPKREIQAKVYSQNSQRKWIMFYSNYLDSTVLENAIILTSDSRLAAYERHLHMQHKPFLVWPWKQTNIVWTRAVLIKAFFDILLVLGKQLGNLFGILCILRACHREFGCSRRFKT